MDPIPRNKSGAKGIKWLRESITLQDDIITTALSFSIIYKLEGKIEPLQAHFKGSV
jgi:hypothetical protein